MVRRKRNAFTVRAQRCELLCLSKKNRPFRGMRACTSVWKESSSLQGGGCGQCTCYSLSSTQQERRVGLGLGLDSQQALRDAGQSSALVFPHPSALSEQSKLR